MHITREGLDYRKKKNKDFQTLHEQPNKIVL